MSQINDDMDAAELERCDTFTDFSPAQDREYFLKGTSDEAWRASVAKWRLECPEEAAAIDARLSGPIQYWKPPSAPSMDAEGAWD